jgi:hypothetical protein
MKLDIEKYDVDYHFASSVFRANESQFLSSVKTVFNEHIQKIKKSDHPHSLVYPGLMTGLISQDERIAPFVQYVSNIAWDILNSQGYNMDLFYTDATEIWGQYHPYTSNMEQHIHGLDVQLCGFYFIDTPPDSSKLFVHDPRAAKIYAGLPERQSDTLTSAHNLVYYNPEPGDLIFTNPWLAHSFSRNQSQLPYNFLHINVRVAYREGNVQSVNRPLDPIVI